MLYQLFDSPFQPLSLLTSNPIDLLSPAFDMEPEELPKATLLVGASISFLKPDRSLPDAAGATIHYLAALAALLSRPLLLVNPLPPPRALELLRTLGHERLLANARRDPEWRTLSFDHRIAKVHAHFADLKERLGRRQPNDLPSLRHLLADLANHVAFLLVHPRD